MDSFQLNAVRHKRHLIAKNLIMDEDTEADLMDKKLINDKILIDVKSEVSNFCQVAKYMDAVEECAGIGKNIFTRFCNFLTARHHWIVDELRVELKALRGELILDEYIRNEAHQLVWDEFGTVLRLKDIEKKDAELLVAIRAQVYKDMWRRAIAEAMQLLDELTKSNNDKVALQRLILAQLSKFLKVHLEENDIETETLLDDNVEIEETLLSDNLKKRVIKLREIADTSLSERRDVLDEKNKALGVMQVNTQQTRLNQEVEKTLVPIEVELENLENQLKMRQERVMELKKQLDEVEQRRQMEIAERDEMIVDLDTKFKDKLKIGRDLKNEMAKLQRHLGQAKILQGKFNMREAVMQHTRNLGFVDGRNKESVNKLTTSQVVIPDHLKDKVDGNEYALPRIR